MILEGDEAKPSTPGPPRARRKHITGQWKVLKETPAMIVAQAFTGEPMVWRRDAPADSDWYTLTKEAWP